MGYGKDVREELRAPTRELRHAIPRVYAGYKQLHDSALAAARWTSGRRRAALASPQGDRLAQHPGPNRARSWSATGARIIVGAAG
jgi:hypothetical protein